MGSLRESVMKKNEVSPVTAGNNSEARKELNKELLAAKNAYNELLGHEERKSQALDDVPVFELTIDKYANITGLSKGVREVLGYSPEELIGLNFIDIVADVEQVEAHFSSFEMFKRRGYVKKKKWKMTKKNGEIIHVLHSARAEYDDFGNYVTGVGYVMDISDVVNANQALMQSEKEKSVILNAMSEGVIYFNSDKKIIWANKIVSNILNIPLTDIKGKECSLACLGLSSGCSGCILDKVIYEKTPQRCEINHKDRTLMVLTHPVLDNKKSILSVVMVISDITDRRLLETQIMELSNNERRRIACDLHDRLGQMLTAIAMLSESLLDVMDKDSENAYSLAQKINTYTGDTQSLMRDILYGIYPIHGNKDNAEDSFIRLAAGISAIHRIECSFEAEGDMAFTHTNTANHLFLIVQEAVNNAVKHSKCTKISIKWQNCGRKRFISVSDNGKGMKNQSSNSGHGFRIMNYRASVIGAGLSIEDNQAGTTVTVNFNI